MVVCEDPVQNAYNGNTQEDDERYNVIHLNSIFIFVRDHKAKKEAEQLNYLQTELHKNNVLRFFAGAMEDC